MRDLDEMKLARVIDAAGGIDGRVKMQKIVYLLKAMGFDLPFDDFAIRQQGPYSRAVACSADLLTGGGFLVESTRELGECNASGEPIVQYSYEVRENFSPFLRENFDIATPAGSPALETIARELKSKDRKTLEVAATKVYLQHEEKLSGSRLDAELEKLKGHLRDAFETADALLDDLKKRRLL
ncbi:MAG TPA: hypothetical protein VNT79_18720 [Phycisphaerae bacterium]|nr:hypothetical protein [Phycisphaerae bacterium]